MILFINYVRFQKILNSMKLWLHLLRHAHMVLLMWGWGREARHPCIALSVGAKGRRRLTGVLAQPSRLGISCASRL